MLVALLPLLACTGSPAPAPPLPAEPAPARPKLVVFVVVDQMSTELFDSQKDVYQRGFRRLIDQGSSGVARHAHAITFTCPGHATLATGTAPSVNGIVGNEWRLPSGDTIGEVVYCADKEFLRVPTLSDQVHAAGGKSVSVSLKDRAAIMMGGRGADVTAWWDTSTNAWHGSPPTPWVTAVDGTPWRNKPWEARRADVYATSGLADDAPWERDPGGLGLTFPHPAAKDLPPKSFLSTPHAGSALTDLAIAALDGDGLGTDEVPDLLSISYSQIDHVGHAFTGRSWETHDAMLALDEDLGRLMDTLDQRIPGQWTLVISADHGAAPPADTRFSLADVTATCDATLQSLGLPAGCVLEEPSLWLSPGARASEKRAEAAHAVETAVTAMTGVDAFAWRAGTAIADSIRLSVDQERSGDLYVLYEPGYIPKYGGNEYAGTSHGTPYDYDQRVPFLAVGAGIKPGALSSEIDTRQIAATAGALLGVKMPPPAMPAAPEVLAAGATDGR